MADVDLMVLGSGMGGLTAAAQAAQLGLSVLVFEKRSAIGGAAALSEGYVWTTPTLEALQAEDPDVDPLLVKVLAEEFDEGVEWVQSLGIDLGSHITGIYRFGHGYRIDINEYFDRCRLLIDDAGGSVRTDATTRRLLVDDGRVMGARVAIGGFGEFDLAARNVVLATGGFQGSPKLRAERIGRQAEEMLLRAPAASTGDGLRLAEAVGADFVDGRKGFYGHLMPSPIDDLSAEDFVSIAVLHSGYCLLFNAAGERFTDESLGDHENNQVVLGQSNGRALLLADDRTRREHLSTAYIPGMQSYDKFGLAEDRGARVSRASSLEELLRPTAAWGYDAMSVLRSVEDYNLRARTAPESVRPPSVHHCRPLDEPPFFAMEVQPSITFAYGGVRVDEQARVLRDGRPIPGLLAAGVDIGGVYTRAYAGSLSRGLVFGRRAAMTAASLESKED